MFHILNVPFICQIFFQQVIHLWILAQIIVQNLCGSPENNILSPLFTVFCTKKNTPAETERLLHHLRVFVKTLFIITLNELRAMLCLNCATEFYHNTHVWHYDKRCSQKSSSSANKKCLLRLQLQTNDWKTRCRREARWRRSVKTSKKEGWRVLLQGSRWWIFVCSSFSVAPSARQSIALHRHRVFSCTNYHWVARPGFWTKWRWWSAQRRPGATSMTCWRRERCWLRKSTTSSSRWRLEIDRRPKSGWAVYSNWWGWDLDLRNDMKTPATD